MPARFADGRPPELHRTVPLPVGGAHDRSPLQPDGARLPADLHAGGNGRDRECGRHAGPVELDLLADVGRGPGGSVQRRPAGQSRELRQLDQREGGQRPGDDRGRPAQRFQRHDDLQQVPPGRRRFQRHPTAAAHLRHQVLAVGPVQPAADALR